MKEYTGCNGLTDIFGCGDNCTWIVLLVAAYFFLSNGCLDNIFGNCENNVIWIILLFVFLYMYNTNTGCDHC